ncbi:T9SS type A sorting domain-containing protein [Hymenobacter canadensis]|uniref:RCC1 domain-containing protein n=1 Tax=Hymenobacter canadensis TaxID=2999067 RepID=UPI0033144E65
MPSHIEGVAAGGLTSYASRADGTVWSWGANSDGLLGDSSQVAQRIRPGTISLSQPLTPNANQPQFDASDTNSAILQSNGTLLIWGRNDYGQLGTGVKNEARHRPSLVPDPTVAVPGTIWSRVVLGQGVTFALRSDRTLWAWGRSESGMLGNGTTAPDVIRPAQIPSPTTATPGSYWSDIAAGQGFALALRSDGTLWAWGYAGYGSLGIGPSTVTYQTTPILVPSPSGALAGTHWTKIATGYTHALAVRSDGTLWTWGRANFGQLGNGDLSTQVAVPTQITNPTAASVGTSWVQVWAGNEHSLALRSDSTLWGWGRNTEGQLGDNTAISRTVPVQEFTRSHWASASGGFFHSLAVRNGKVFACGGMNFNTNAGQLGDGTRNGSAYFRASLVPVLASANQRLSRLVFSPNPAHASVVVTGLPIGTRVLLMDISGRRVQEVHLNMNREIPLDAFPPGIYIIQAYPTNVPPLRARLVIE